MTLEEIRLIVSGLRMRLRFAGEFFSCWLCVIQGYFNCSLFRRFVSRRRATRLLKEASLEFYSRVLVKPQRMANGCCKILRHGAEFIFAIQL
jgi:hypothetical protein